MLFYVIFTQYAVSKHFKKIPTITFFKILTFSKKSF